MGQGMERRAFLRDVLLGSAYSVGVLGAARAAQGASPPNIILCMADDLGWGDVGFHDHPILKTPHLDAMAREGLRLDRFYSAAPVCSPTRGSCLTGRHPFRYGIYGANKGSLPKEECTLAEYLRAQGYLTGHFGKWHLGTLTTTEKDSNRGGPEGAAHYSPPWENGFEVCFSTEAKVPTWDPMEDPDHEGPYGTYYWRDEGVKATESLTGDDSRIIMDRVIPFLRRAKSEGRPFFAVVWFHSPHLPVVAGPEYRRPYADQPEAEQAYYGCIAALDEQMGRLRRHLADFGMKENTLLTFCSDNGPEGKAGEDPGRSGPFRGRKRDLLEGGVRVPSLIEWPAVFKTPALITAPGSTSDYFPTILEALGLDQKMPLEPADGCSLFPMLRGECQERPTPLGFEHREFRALIDNRYKIISLDAGKHWALYDLLEDPGESTDLAQTHPEELTRLKAIFTRWRASCRESRAGADYR